MTRLYNSKQPRNGLQYRYSTPPTSQDPHGLQSLHCVPVKLVLGDAPAATQPHRGHTLRPRRLVERCVSLPPRLSTTLRRRLPGN